VSKQLVNKMDMDRFNLRKLNEREVKSIRLQ
jgi:DNA-binding Xre family transcriptional regulator